MKENRTVVQPGSPHSLLEILVAVVLFAFGLSMEEAEPPVDVEI